MWRIALVVSLAGVSSLSVAAPRERSPLLRALVECRTIGTDTQRLACYDRQVATLDAAQQSGDIVVADKAQIRESRKALFGFGALQLPVLGGGDGASDDAPTQIEANITGVRDAGYGKWEYTLDNGMRWLQVEGSNDLPRAGQHVTIRAAAFGSYFLKVGKQRAVRAMRVH